MSEFPDLGQSAKENGTPSTLPGDTESTEIVQKAVPTLPTEAFYPSWENRTEALQDDGNRGRRSRVQNVVEQQDITTIPDAELLFTLLGTRRGSKDFIERLQQLTAGYTFIELLQMDIGYLQQSVGSIKGLQLKALLEIARRLTIPPAERYFIQSPGDVFRLVVADMAYLDHEEVKVLLLDVMNKVVAKPVLYKGTIGDVTVRVAELFKPAIARNCPKVIICHNHPSNEVLASDSDILLTKKCIMAGKMLDIEVVDHLIIGRQRYLSLRQELKEKGEWED